MTIIKILLPQIYRNKTIIDLQHINYFFNSLLINHIPRQINALNKPKYIQLFNYIHTLIHSSISKNEHKSLTAPKSNRFSDKFISHKPIIRLKYHFCDNLFYYTDILFYYTDIYFIILIFHFIILIFYFIIMIFYFFNYISFYYTDILFYYNDI